MRPSDLKNQKFGRLLAVERVDNSKSGQARWLCRCECGNETIAVSAKLKSGHTRSCGCINTDRFTELGKNKKRRYFKCSVDGCERKPDGKYCGMHRARILRNGSLNISRRPNGTGNIGKNGYVDMHINGRRVYEHVLVAERALGKKLPAGAVVHHVNGIRSDNRPANLVICPNESYHRLLHKRTRTLAI